MNEGVEHVTPNMWNNFANCVVKEEDKFWAIDFITDELLDDEPGNQTSHILTITKLSSSEFDNDDDDK